MSLTELEAAIVHAIDASRDSPFGADIRSNAPGRRSGRPGERSARFPALADFELSMDPPLRRTVAILGADRITRGSLSLDAADRTHIGWVEQALEALRAITDRFWGRIRPDVRLLFTDADDAQALPFQATYMLPRMRLAHPPNLAASGVRASIGEVDLRWLKGAWTAAQHTDAYVAALHAQQRVRADSRTYERLRHGRARLVGSPPQPQRGEGMSQYAARLVAHYVESHQDQIAEDAEIVRALRSYNRLIHAVLVAWLAGLEHEPSLPHVDPGYEAISVDAGAHGLTVAVTLRRSIGGLWLRVYSPFVIDLGCPVDGLYLTMGFNWLSSGGDAVVDLSGDRIRELSSMPRIETPR